MVDEESTVCPPTPPLPPSFLYSGTTDIRATVISEGDVMFRFVIPAIVILLSIPTMSTAVYNAANPAPGAWPMYRHNTRQTGRATSISRMRNAPVEKWRTYLGAPLKTLAASDQADSAWVFDIDGDGQREKLILGALRIVRDGTGAELWRDTQTGQSFAPSCVQVADFLPDSAGLEIVACTSNIGTGEGYAYLFSFHDGVENGRLVWKSANFGDMYGPEVIAGDFDSDGIIDIAIAPHYRIRVLNPLTGTTRFIVNWDVGRNYGHFASADFTGDGIRDFVVISDFATHLSVVKNTGTGGSLIWKQTFGAVDGSQKDVIVRPYAHSVGDLDGDGVVEITLSLHNRPVKDGQWHATAYRGSDGAVVMDQAGRFIRDITDADADGIREIFTVDATGTTLPLLGTLRITNWSASGGVDERWQKPNAAFVMTTIGPDTSWNSIAAHGDEVVLLADLNGDGTRDFITQDDSDGDGRADRVRAWSIAPGGAITQWFEHAHGGPVNVEVVRGSDPATITMRDLVTNQLSALTTENSSGTPEGSDTPGGWTPTPIVADLDGDGGNEIIVTSSGGDVVVYETGAGDPVERWRKAGYAEVYQPGYTINPLSVVADDLDGDGTREIIARRRDSEGHATLVVYNHDGTVRWEHVFSEIIDGQIEAAVDAWITGYFTGDDSVRDISVQLHAKARASFETLMLDGRDRRQSPDDGWLFAKRV
jgi:hypothetical protein